MLTSINYDNFGTEENGTENSQEFPSLKIDLTFVEFQMLQS